MDVDWDALRCRAHELTKRQLLWEHGGPTMLIDTPAGVQTMTEVLPQAFGVDNLDRVANQQEKS